MNVLPANKREGKAAMNNGSVKLALVGAAVSCALFAACLMGLLFAGNTFAFFTSVQTVSIKNLTITAEGNSEGVKAATSNVETTAEDAVSTEVSSYPETEGSNESSDLNEIDSAVTDSNSINADQQAQISTSKINSSRE